MIFPVVQSLASRQAGCSDRVGWVADGMCVRSASSLSQPPHTKSMRLMCAVECLRLVSW